ncbi:MAG: glycoside hydrolase family 130 protein [Sedimentisphaerales bacterium]|nr:glycoside hydrolase family 130 protein [Sedimentisphaerales bacterium]
MTTNSATLLTKECCRDIVHRWQYNPLIGIKDLDFNCADIHNAGVVYFKGEVLLLVTIEYLTGHRGIHLARPTSNGHYKVESKPFLKQSGQYKYLCHESRGVLDGRVTFLDGIYYILYNSFGNYGYRLALAKTQDFERVERIGFISEPDTKAGVLFPAKIKDRYARLERPGDSSIWVTYSDDLIHWGGSERVISPRGGFWDESRIGAGATPIEIDEGWLVLYYGVKETPGGPIYRIGAVILNKMEPTEIVGRTNIPILSPRENYERIGDVPNLVFPSGALVDDKGNLKIFYGAANSCICVGTTTIAEIVANCFESKVEY